MYFDIDAQRETIIDMYPPLEGAPDEDLPDEVKTPLREAYGSLGERNWNASVVMSRRAIEEAAANLGASGRNLQDQIDDLETQRKITPYLK